MPQGPDSTQTPQEGVLQKLVELFRPTVVDEVALRVHLAKAGFSGPQVAFLNLYGILRRTASQPPRFLDSTLRALLASPDPDLALNNLEHLVQRHFEDRDLPWTFTGETYATLLRLLGSSQAIADGLIRRPELIAVLGEPKRPPSREELFRSLHEELAAARDFDSRLATLKTLRERELLRLAALELVWGEDIVSVSRGMSHLACTLIQGALDIARAESSADASADSGFAIIGLGKLGGDELNYSSDVDLIFLNDTNETTEDCIRLGREMFRILSHRDEDGQLLRVDLRLRPEGDTGPITRSLSSAVAYYQKHGRPWERQMLVKARPVAGDLELGRQFLEEVRPFVIGPSLDSAAITQIKSLRTQMERAVEPKGEDRLEIKRGRGGIRDIEYTVQFLQLLHAHTHPSVIHHNTMESLVRLERVKAITRDEGDGLRSAYRFLRRVENRLQLHHRIATHRVPGDEEEVRRLARSLGESGPDCVSRFRHDLDTHRTRARQVYTKLLGGLFADTDGSRAEAYDLILDPSPDDEAIQRALGRYHFQDVHTAFRNLKKLGESNSRVLPTAPRTRKFYASVFPTVLERIASTPDPDQALSNLERFSRGSGGKALFFRLLRDEPSVLKILIGIASHSQLLSDLLIREPECLDPFIDSLLVEKLGRRRRERGLTVDHLRDGTDPVVRLSDFKNLETLRIGTRDIEGKQETLATLFSLSRLATTIVKRAWALESTKPPQPPPCPSAVLAVGKLGGLEINYGSDLDLLFVIDPQGAPSDAISYWTDRAKHFIRTLSTLGSSGRLYRIDTRLRPEGESGPLVTSLSALSQYYSSDRCHLFEWQSLLRLRFVAGDRELGGRVIDTVRQSMRQKAFEKEALASHMHDMRRKIQGEAKGVDVKRGPGGIIDIEFIVQFLQLLHSDRSALMSPNTARALRRLREGGLLDDNQGRELLSAYVFFRRVESSLQIVYGLDQETLPTDPLELSKLARRLRMTDDADDENSLLDVFERKTALTRECFEAIIR